MEAFRTKSATRKARAASLVLILALAPLALGQQGPGGRGNQPGLPVPKKMAPPADPAKVHATYQIGDEKVTVTEGDFFAFYQTVAPHEETPAQPLQPHRLMEMMLQVVEARALGCEPSDAELEALNPTTLYPDQAAMWRERWETQGIDWPEYKAYLRISLAIQRMRDLLVGSERVLSSEIFDDWKQEHQYFRLAYVAFPAAEHREKLRTSPPDDKTLREFWSTNAQVQNKYRKPASVTLEIVVLDFGNLEEDTKAKVAAAGPIAYEDALRYFNQNRARLIAQVPSEERHRLHPREKVPVEELVTPFELLRDQIKCEMVLGDTLAAAYDEAKAAGNAPDLEAIARKHGLRHVRIDRADRLEILRNHADFGADLFEKAFNAPIGSLSPEIVINRNLHFFWRVRDRVISELPDYEAIKESLVEDWIEQNAYRLAHEAAVAMAAWIDGKVAEEAAAELKRIDDETEAKIQKEIADRQITNETQKNQVQMRLRAFAEQEKRKIKDALAPKHFDAFVKEHGLTAGELGPFEFVGAQQDRREITDPKEQLEAFLTSHFPIRAMMAGQVSAVMSDIVTQTHLMVKVVAKEDAPFESMSAADYHQRRLNVERRKTYMATLRVGAQELQRKYQWTEN